MPATSAGELQHLSRPDLAALYIAVRTTTRDLCAPLSAEDQMVQPMPDASPAKWHQAHTTWFFETFILLPHATGYCVFDERFQFFFNSYYKQLGGHPIRYQRGLWSRPSLEEVLAYRAHVDQAMLRLLDGPVSREVRELVMLGCNHEQQHQELIVTDIKYALWTNPLRPSYRQQDALHAPASSRNTEMLLPPPLPAAGPTFALDRRPPAEPASLRWFEYGGGVHWIGHQGDSFCFDNELPHHKVFIEPFQIASRLVTNTEYLAFMNDNGYQRPELWLSEGWDTINSQNWRAPLYWHERDGSWTVYTLDGNRPVDPAEPVCHISYFEADAYARWAGARLATEFEWELAAAGVPLDSETNASGSANLLDLRRLHPQAHRDAEQAVPAQMLGDVWEWTASQYLPYPGFRPAAGAVGEYNGKFMCNQFVLRGGSCATPADHIRRTYRNFFPPQARWQFSGIRLAK